KRMDTEERPEPPPHANEHATPLIQGDNAPRSVTFHPEEPSTTREVEIPRKSDDSFAATVGKWWRNPPSEIWIVLIVIIIAAAITIIAICVGYESLLEETRRSCGVMRLRRTEE
ncbi:hypothetical protein PENTCL1PPCAC_19703, partial [Pristionchus entomophagus]